MARIQTDIVPSLELLKPRFTAAGAKPEHPDWERLRSKMTEILKLLPRLKVPPDPLCCLHDIVCGLLWMLRLVMKHPLVSILQFMKVEE